MAGLSRNNRCHENGSYSSVEVLLGLPPLCLNMEAEAQAGIYGLSCNEQRKPRSIRYGHANKVWDMMKEHILQMRTDRMIPRHVSWQKRMGRRFYTY
jgi:hypothetical protein